MLNNRTKIFLVIFLCILVNLCVILFSSAYYNRTSAKLLTERKNLLGTLKQISSNYTTLSLGVNDIENYIEFEKSGYDEPEDSAKFMREMSQTFERYKGQESTQYSWYYTQSKAYDTLEFTDKNSCLNRIIIKIPSINIAVPEGQSSVMTTSLSNSYSFPYFATVYCAKTKTMENKRGIYTGEFSDRDYRTLGFRLSFSPISTDYNELEFEIVGVREENGDFRGTINWIYTGVNENPNNLDPPPPPKPPGYILPFAQTFIKFVPVKS